jgi:hypothetical protein
MCHVVVEKQVCKVYCLDSMGFWEGQASVNNTFWYYQENTYYKSIVLVNNDAWDNSLRADTITYRTQTCLLTWMYTNTKIVQYYYTLYYYCMYTHTHAETNSCTLTVKKQLLSNARYLIHSYYQESRFRTQSNRATDTQPITRGDLNTIIVHIYIEGIICKSIDIICTLYAWEQCSLHTGKFVNSESPSE